ncbi:hypothetical protein BaRGS_00035283 [Batillaria attramentaria]|uniref:Uncharacterized protein n=1 Tax=Batillaria attramentaria TaxID=370345 RepID=A0ABD0JEI0_9CAEN
MSLNCWTLWQRMPPRYQLTMRDVRQEDDVTPARATTPSPPSRASSASPRSPRLRSPRAVRRLGSARARVSQDGAMLTSGVLPEEYARDTEYGPQSPVLPPRSSPYINNMKNQMRLNSARRKMDESCMTSPIPKSYTPKPRATTAPPFPITKLSSHEDHVLQHVASPRHHHDHHSQHQHQRIEDVHQQPKSKQQRGFTGMRSPKRPSSGYALLDPRRVAVHTIAPFGELSAEGSSPVFHPRSPRQQDCVIGDYQIAALYLDRGRVTFFRKTKPDVAQSVYSAMNPFMTTRDDGSYLAHLRKAYLSGVRDLPKVSSKQPDMEKHTTIQERMDYDRKVGRILDYYAKVDIPKNVHAPRPPNAQFAQTAHSSQQRAFRTLSSRKRAPGSTEITAPGAWQEGEVVNVSQLSPRMSHSQFHSHPHHFHMRDASGFVRINAQARLHDRFYLRTPGGDDPAAPSDTHQPPGVQDMSSCACGMCRIEMEVALMAQLQREMGVPVETFTSSGQALPHGTGTAGLGNTASPRQPPLGVVSEEDSCPARPNSVSDSRKPAQGGQQFQEGHRTATQTGQGSQATPNEPASLTVTLPGVGESSEGGTGPATTERESHTDGLASTDRSEGQGEGPVDTGRSEQTEKPLDKATQHTPENDRETTSTTTENQTAGGAGPTSADADGHVDTARSEELLDKAARHPQNDDKTGSTAAENEITGDKADEASAADTVITDQSDTARAAEASDEPTESGDKS